MINAYNSANATAHEAAIGEAMKRQARRDNHFARLPHTAGYHSETVAQKMAKAISTNPVRVTWLATQVGANAPTVKNKLLVWDREGIVRLSKGPQGADVVERVNV